MSFTRKPGSRLYTPPAGYFDLPFIWAYDASVLTNGQLYPNQYRYLQGGYGDFLLRRIVGLSRILDPTTGQFQIQDNAGAYIESAPVFGVSADDIGLAPELRYQETGAIKFDLGTIALPEVPSTAQIAFAGARRMKGNPPKNPTYQAMPRTYTYQVSAPVNPPIGSYVTVRQQVNNYDFELYQLIILVGGGQTITDSDETQNGVHFTNISPYSIRITIPIVLGTQDFSMTYDGSTLTINVAAIGGNALTTTTELANAINSDPVIGKLIFAQQFGNDPAGTIDVGFNEVALGYAGSFNPCDGEASIWLYDSNKVQISNAPILDLFMDGSPRGTYKNGALCPPLWYPKDSQIQIDVYSQLAVGSAILQIYLVGRQYIPC